ncbi:hypothetical protein [Eoetvoesiella caeni]|uniref:Uncharacterized protein n=1 Tax=Eoetvoesiella caeni TaxID=645616 RepID=A0A366HB12_9BURK|nr:hypothetical protein [Eoetvoesiella caeni]MCI2809542.1 hypothetical protein [Eoetvoesiella caeni]NYT56038.1 hypothetical protein [Eoetvoesiella caeni]RBP38802.1 hypothetical protein DFR37_10694 [Eoetvoesiella caeni]
MFNYGRYPLVLADKWPTVSPAQAHELLLRLARVGEAYSSGDVRLSDALPIERDAELRAVFGELVRFADAIRS